jgi:hypothetical protein
LLFDKSLGIVKHQEPKIKKKGQVLPSHIPVETTMLCYRYSIQTNVTSERYLFKSFKA